MTEKTPKTPDQIRDLLRRLERVSKYMTQDLIMTLHTLTEDLEDSDLLTSLLIDLSSLSDLLSRPESLTESDRLFVSETVSLFSDFLRQESDRLFLYSPETLSLFDQIRESLTRLSFSVSSVFLLYNLSHTVKTLTGDLEIIETLIGLSVSLEDLRPKTTKEISIMTDHNERLEKIRSMTPSLDGRHYYKIHDQTEDPDQNGDIT